MKISVLRENNLLREIDLAQEVYGSTGGELVFLIGRSKDCHVHLDDFQVSRHHAELVYHNGEWRVRRASDVSPLVVNGVQTNEKALVNGDIIAAGPYVLSVSSLAVEEPPQKEIVPEESINDAQETKTILEAPEEAAGPSLHEETQEINLADVEETPAEAPIEEEHVLADGFDASDFESAEDLQPDEEGDDESVGEFTSVGNLSSAFSGENTESVFPEDNDEEIEVDGLDDFGDDSMMGGDEDSTRVIQAFAKFDLELFGEFAPYDKFSIDKNETIIGRDASKCDIVLNDPEVSSVHAKIIRNNVNCILEDQQSGNGTLLNGERINKSALNNGDEFVIGATTFTLKIVSDFLEEEKDRLMPVEDNQVVEVEEVVEVDSAFDDETGVGIEGQEGFGEGAAPKNQSLVDKFKALPPKKKIIYGAVGFMLVLMLLDTEPQAPKAPETTQTKAKEEPKPEGEEEVQLTPEQLELVEASYQLANEMIQRGLFDEALMELDNNVLKFVKEYKNAGQLKALALRGIEERERIEEERRKRLQEEERKAKVAELVEKAKEAVKERNVQVAESLFAEITLLDPNNFDVSALKIEIDAWKKEQERIALEKAQKEAERKRKISLLQPGKTFYLQKEWYNAVIRLTEFLLVENMDEDLTLEATKMLEESKENLNAIVGPLLGRARSLREGQDLKGAYENYNEVLKHEPTNAEALNEMNEIREILHARSRKVYREAIIAESLSLFQDAKEKFQEVQQISPSDSEYYGKATEKLKEYID